MWPNPQETADLVIFTEEILNGKRHFLCSGSNIQWVVHRVLTCWKVKLTFSKHCIKSVRIRSYSVRMWENWDQINSEYRHLSRSEKAVCSCQSKSQVLPSAPGGYKRQQLTKSKPREQFWPFLVWSSLKWGLRQQDLSILVLKS